MIRYWLKKLLSVVLMIVSILGFLLSLVGVAGGLIIRAPLVNAASVSLETAESVFSVMDSSTERIQLRVSDLQELVSGVQDELIRAEISDGEIISAVVVRLTGEKFINSVSNVVGLTNEWAENITSLNNSLVAVNQLPGVNLPTLTEEMEAVGSKIDSVQTVYDGLSSSQKTRDAILEPVTAIATGLDQVSAEIARERTQIETVLGKLDELGVVIPRVINTGSVLLSLISIGLAAGQVLLFKFGLKLFKTGEKGN